MDTRNTISPVFGSGKNFHRHVSLEFYFFRSMAHSDFSRIRAGAGETNVTTKTHCKRFSSKKFGPVDSFGRCLFDENFFHSSVVIKQLRPKNLFKTMLRLRHSERCRSLVGALAFRYQRARFHGIHGGAAAARKRFNISLDLNGEWNQRTVRHFIFQCFACPGLGHNWFFHICSKLGRHMANLIRL